jgi:hypothetical protein
VIKSIIKKSSFAVFIVSTVLLLTPKVQAAADTCTWTGAVNSNWSDGGNWSGCDNAGVPESGDTLVFPEAASNKSTNNDFIGAAFKAIQIPGSGYTLSGGSITMNGTTPLVALMNATINLDITYTPSMNAFIGASTGQTLTINGTTNFSGIVGGVRVGWGGVDGTVDFVGNIVGDAGSIFIAENGARAIVRGATNTFTSSNVGAETNATFECQSTTCFGDNANDIYSGGGIVNFRIAATYSNDILTSVTTPDVSAFWAADDVVLNGNTTVNDDMWYGQSTSGKTLTVNGDIDLVDGNLEISGVDRTNTILINGIISGSHDVYAYSSTLILDGANTYTGGTGATSGAATIIVTNASGLGASSSGTGIGNGDVIKFDFAIADTVAEPFIIVGDGEGNGALVQIGETTTLSGNILLVGDATIGVDSTAVFSAFSLSGVISGTGDITVTTSPTTALGNSSIQFTGASANTYVGKLIVSGVRFYPSKAHGVNAVTGDMEVLASATKNSEVTTAFNESIANTSHITLTNNGARKAYLAIGSLANETVGYVTGDGTINLGSGSELVLSYSGDYSFDGNITKFSNTDDSFIVKQGSGNATFTGGTEGPFYPMLEARNGTLTINTSNFTTIGTNVLPGATLKGNGSLGGTTVHAGGVVNVGNSPGCMTLNDLLLNSGSVFIQEIAGVTACSQYDQTNVVGVANLNNATLQVVLTYAPANGATFTILTAGSVVGTFNGLPDGSVVVIEGRQFRINYTATTVTLTDLTNTVPTLANTGNNILLQLVLCTSIGIFVVVISKKSYVTNR